MRHFCPTGSGYRPRDTIESGSDLDTEPDPQHYLRILIDFCFVNFRPFSCDSEKKTFQLLVMIKIKVNSCHRLFNSAQHKVQSRFIGGSSKDVDVDQIRHFICGLGPGELLSIPSMTPAEFYIETGEKRRNNRRRKPS